MTLPIVIVDREGVDLSVYASIADAESELEVIDVRNSEFRAYDAAGRLLTILIATEQSTTAFGLLPVAAEVVKIQEGEADPSHQAELRSALIDYLIALGAPVQIVGDLALEDLIGQASECASRNRA